MVFGRELKMDPEQSGAVYWLIKMNPFVVALTKSENLAPAALVNMSPAPFAEKDCDAVLGKMFVVIHASRLASRNKWPAGVGWVPSLLI